jgi:hypothetical protein
MTDIALRNRQIKKILEQAFGRGKVRVRNGRGTSWGWAHIDIGYAPADWQQERELNALARKLIHAAGIDLFHYYGDMDNMPRDEMSVTFAPCRNSPHHAQAIG